MKTPVHHSFLRCALGLALSVGCAVIAQTAAPAPASGGAPRSGTTGGTTTRSGTGTTATRNGATAPTASGTTGTTTTGTTNGTGTTTTGTNANGTTTTGTGNATGTTATANTAGTNATGTSTRGTANQNGVTTNSGTNPAGTLSSSGTIGNFGANDFSLQGTSTTSPNATPSDFLIGPDTLFVDPFGNSVPRDRFFRRGSQVPATVYYSRTPDGKLMASKVVLTENQTAVGAPVAVESAGTITEVSPGILVIQQPGASDTPVRYVNNKTTNYVNENGEPVPPESVKAGTPVKIFYTKVGDTLVASRVEVHRNNDGGLPKPVVPSERSSTRPAKK